jgi:2-polyprenyl-3-methyl-5-hydroxy-6-metoxy-1,4-benzoquinol methylase
MYKCLFCNSESFTSSPFEDTLFNDKRFEYKTCTSCQLVQVDPLPTLQDLTKMYAMDYYGLKKVHPSNEYDTIFSQIKQLGDFKSVLDFGCGGCRFLVNAMDKGYEVTGVDFGNELIKNLENAYPQARFQEIETFYTQNDYYDVIFVSNVFEHLTNPVEILHKLAQRLKPNGILVVDGPVENNITLAGLFRNVLFGLRKKMGKVVSHAPTHLFYSNAKNQRQFFEQSGLETITYRLVEGSWPFPSKWSLANGLKAKCFYAVAQISIFLGKLLPNNGNVFYYIGRKN